MVLGQLEAVLSGTCWYWVSISLYCLILGGAVSVWGFYACIYQKIEFCWVSLMPDTLSDRQQNIELLILSKV